MDCIIYVDVNMDKIGTHLKHLRKEAKISQTLAADYCKISQTYLSQIENNKRNLSFKLFTLLLKTYNASINLHQTTI